MSFRRKFARRNMSYIEKTAQPDGNRNIRRNRERHSTRFSRRIEPTTKYAVTLSVGGRDSAFGFLGNKKRDDNPTR